MPPKDTSSYRTNVSPTGYSYGGNDYKYEQRTDPNGNKYQVDIMTGKTPTQLVQNNPVTTTPTQNPINIGQAYGSDTDLEAYNNVGNYYKGIAEAPIDENAIRQQKLDQIQSEINAQNAIYADKLSRARTQGQGRLGEDTARQARGGLIGSDFGAAQTSTTRDYNTGVENSIEAERNAVIERIRSQARTDASAEIAAKRAAKEAGYKEYTAYLTASADRKAANTDKVIKQLLASGLDPTTADKALIDEIAKNYGISSADVINGYKLQSYSTQESEKARKQALADDIAKKGPISLAEGNRLYDPATGKELAYNPKTYAPKASTGGGTTGGATATGLLQGVPQNIADAALSIKEGRSKLNEYPSALRVQINSAANKLYAAEGGNELAQTAYDAVKRLETNPGFSGAIGTNALLGFGKSISGSESAGYLADLDQLKAALKLVNVKYLKGTGALSDTEGQTLERAGTTLDPRMPETQFLQELARVKAALEKANALKGEGVPQPITAPDGQQVIITD